ncbi:flavodoxin domain-containing protein [Streptomyces sp. 21So2-11]|uniref:flavodoxin domain-containing protein n=1 Tax=Streptomyces sp. 21So2-11 TaxID=3144408 RepID=UPI00321AEF9C
MTLDVLVAHAGKNGSTAEIAHWIAETLRTDGVCVHTRPAALEGAPERYDAVVLGSSLYAGRWHRQARRFAHRHARALAVQPLWLFSSGPLDTSAADRDLPPVRGVARLASHLHARGHATFGGRLTQDAEGPIARMLLRQGRGGDFRDEQQIRTWAHVIARELTAARPAGAIRPSAERTP